MAGVRQGATVEDNEPESAGAPPAVRIDTDIFATLTETAGRESDDAPTIVGWFDCWRR
ncbi:hypothetical protein [Haloarcula sediminis]|uniref:hypothetical protein n=1 Tax=Haloarcula sediminis TaxID=3111777 RepID=UPI002D7838A4|nr:hypothetical protein [Haloarcula sp. CK38]